MTGKFDIHSLWERCVCGADTITSLLGCTLGAQEVPGPHELTCVLCGDKLHLAREVTAEKRLPSEELRNQTLQKAVNRLGPVAACRPTFVGLLDQQLQGHQFDCRCQA